MSNIKIQQFDGSNYSLFLPQSQASNYRYEGNIQKIGRDNITDSGFVAELDNVFQTMPNKSCRNILWQDHPTTGGATYMGILYKLSSQYGCLVSYSYTEASWFRFKYNGVWKEFKQMALLDSDYLKSTSALSFNNLDVFVNKINTYQYTFSQGDSTWKIDNAYNKSVYFGSCKSPCMYNINGQWKLGCLFTPTKKYFRNDAVSSIEVTFPVGTFIIVTTKDYALNQEQVILNEDISMGVNQYTTFKIRAANSNSFGYYWSFYYYYETSDGYSTKDALRTCLIKENTFTSSYSLSKNQQTIEYIDGYKKTVASVYLPGKITS